MHRRLCTSSELDDAGLLFPVMERFKSVDLLDICRERPCRIHSAFAVPGSSLALESTRRASRRCGSSRFRAIGEGHSPILDLRADLHPNEPHSGPPRLLRTAGVPCGHPLDLPSMACGRGSSDRRSLADWVELPVGDPRANGLAHGLTGRHSLDLPAPSGGLFALRRRYEPQRLPVHHNRTTPLRTRSTRPSRSCPKATSTS